MNFSAAFSQIMSPHRLIFCGAVLGLYRSIVYDWRVERRQQIVMNTAVQSTVNASLLEELVKERTRKLEESNQQLEEANRKVTQASAARLKNFASMSHEIRYVRVAKTRSTDRHVTGSMDSRTIVVSQYITTTGHRLTALLGLQASLKIPN